MYKTIVIVIVGLLITAQSALSAPYFVKPDPVYFLAIERKAGCNAFGAHFVHLTGMKALDKSVYYYDQDGKLKLKLKSIWEYKKGR